MEEINIKDYFKYLKHYIAGFIILTILIVGGVAVYDLGIKKPVYQASTSVVIARADSSEGGAATVNEINAGTKLANTYSEIAKSELVLNQVIENMRLSTSSKELSKNVTIKPVEDTSIIKISVRDRDPEQAAKIANEIATVFSQEIAKIYKLENVSQLSVAVAPTAPANNTLIRDLILAAAATILGVAAFAFLKFYLDDSVKHSDDVEKMIGLPITGTITKSDAKLKSTGELIVARSPKSIVSENIKSLRTNLQFTGIDSNIKTILVTSTNAGEGKSFVSANLAVSFAQAGNRVLLVDCDLRKGRVHKLFKILNTGGLSNLLAGSLKDTRTFIRDTSVDNLDVLTCGTYPPNPSELLASQKNKKLIFNLRSHYDIVIFDGAPVGGLADSVILSSLVDETIVVVKDASTSKNDLIATREALERVGAKIAGVVFNMSSHRSSKYYNNYYYYSDADDSRTRKK